MGIVSQTKGAISDREMKLFIQASPTLGSTYEGYMKQLELLERLAARDSQFYQEYIDKSMELDESGISLRKQQLELEKFASTWKRNNPLFTREETEYLLVDCHYLGIENVMALRGDARSEQKYFEPTDGGHPFAIDLVKQIQDLNCGKYLHETIESEYSSEFCIGVAGYPEKHLESPSLQSDLKRLKEKVEAGADYVVTQMFFNNQKYFEFVEAAKNIGITVPIIPGIKPIAVKRHLQLLPQVFRIDIPQDLIEAVDGCTSNKDVRAVGIEWAIQQSKELKEAGVPVLHYYSMGKSDNIKAIAKELF